MKDEQKLNAWIREQLRTTCDVVRIENTISSGMPDLNICRQGHEVWVESKVMVLGRVLLRKEQFAWGVRRSAHGGHVRILAWHPAANTLFGWRYPLVGVREHGEYLQVTNDHHAYGFCDKSFNLKTFLFT
ncbi:hypothetical protein EPO05_06475 [Patescibacteria group bacterium]|nr:MAG: hypothetical protein EPO05_06475 [Patescibacteria group bacterium]